MATPRPNDPDPLFDPQQGVPIGDVLGLPERPPLGQPPSPEEIAFLSGPVGDPLGVGAGSTCAKCGGTEFDVVPCASVCGHCGKPADSAKPTKACGCGGTTFRVETEHPCKGCGEVLAGPLVVPLTDAPRALKPAPPVPARFVVHGADGARWRLPQEDGDAPRVAMRAILDPGNPDALALELLTFGEPPEDARYDWQDGKSCHYYCAPGPDFRREIELTARAFGRDPAAALACPVEVVHLECIDMPLQDLRGPYQRLGPPPASAPADVVAEIEQLLEQKKGKTLQQALLPEALVIRGAHSVRPSVATVAEFEALPLWEPPAGPAA